MARAECMSNVPVSDEERILLQLVAIEKFIIIGMESNFGGQLG